MKFTTGLSALALILAAGAAQAQTASETTTTQQSTVAPAPVAPAPGTLSVTKESHASDGYGDRTDQKSTSFRSGSGVAAELEKVCRDDDGEHHRTLAVDGRDHGRHRAALRLRGRCPAGDHDDGAQQHDDDDRAGAADRAARGHDDDDDSLVVLAGALARHASPAQRETPSAGVAGAGQREHTFFGVRR